MEASSTRAATDLFGLNRAVGASVAAGPGGDWPRTTRILPWMIAGFLVMLWLVPVDATSVPVALPFDSTIDRLVLGALVLVWLAVNAVPGEYGPLRRRSSVNVAVAVFVIIAAASVLFNIASIARAEELQLAINSLSLAVSYAVLFLIVATVIRKQEIPRFAVLIVALGCVTALGTIIEYRAGTNYFYDLAGKLLLGAQVGPENPDIPGFRPQITGPTEHGLAVATMLAMAVPFALVGLLGAKDTTRRFLFALALGLILAGGAATLRKTGLVAPAAALVPLIFYRPREMAKLLPLAILLLGLVLAAAPGALEGIGDQVTGQKEVGDESRNSVAGRVTDYAAVEPDILSHPLLGRGYGTYDPNVYQAKEIPTRHRFLDNEYLARVLETGLLGVIAYLGLGLAGMAALHRQAGSRDLARAGPALALVGAIAAFLVCGALFNLMAFVQVPYLLFFLLGLAVVATAVEHPSAG